MAELTKTKRISQTPIASLSSASPTPSSFSSYSKHSDTPSPRKRKLNNSQSFSSTNSALSSDSQLDAARRAASSRVLNVWASLEHKYACRLDEDDIVDLRSVSIIKDRGVLSSSKGVFGFGCFELDTQTDDVENEGEDEFGGWTSDLELLQFSQVYQPARMKFDPADADDLEEFLTAEGSRKCNHSIPSSCREWDGDGEEEGEKGEDAPNTKIDLLYPSDEGEDELAGYDASVGEGAMLWEVERPPEPQVPPSKFPTIIKVRSQTSASPQHSKSRSPSTRPTSPCLPPFKTLNAPTALTPLTQRLSIQSKKSRATSVSPTKRLVPEVLLSKLKSPALGFKSKQISSTYSHKSTPLPRLQLAKGPESSASGSMESHLHVDTPIEMPTMSRIEDIQHLNNETVSNNLPLGHPADNNSQRIARSSASTSMKDRAQTPHLSMPPQEDKPQLLPVQSAAPQCIPNSSYIFPFMPSYPPCLPDWSAPYRQNPAQIPFIYPTDPRFYFAQVMHGLSFLLNPAQVGNPQTSWPLPLSHTLPTSSLPTLCPVLSDQKPAKGDKERTKD